MSLADRAVDLIENPIEQFLAILATSLVSNDMSELGFVKLSLGKYRGTEEALNKISVRLLEVKGQPHLSFVYHYQTKDVTKNFSLNDGQAKIKNYLDQSQAESFKSGLLRLQSEEIQLLFNRKNQSTLSTQKTAITAVVAKAHDREKFRYLEINRPFLKGLGVTDANNQLIPAMSRKWKQINKFIEVFQHAFDSLKLPKDHPVHVVDFGAGKGYLTFAIHDYLRENRGFQANVTGV